MSFTKERAPGLHETSLSDAEKIFGKDGIISSNDAPRFLEIDPKKDVSLPWSQAELERAKRQRLTPIYYYAHNTQGPLTAGTIQRLSGKAWGADRTIVSDPFGDVQKLLDNTSPPLEGWRLVSEHPTAGTQDKDVIEQTEALIQFLDLSFPIWKYVVEEFNDVKEELRRIAKRERLPGEEYLSQEDWAKAVKKLQNLAITTLTRESLSEVLYRIAARREKSSGLRRRLPLDGTEGPVDRTTIVTRDFMQVGAFQGYCKALVMRISPFRRSNASLAIPPVSGE